MTAKIDNYSFLEKELEFAKLEIANLHDDIHELIAERDALRAEVQTWQDQAKAYWSKIEQMERQEPSHWGCTVLQSDGRWKEEVSREAPPEAYFSVRDIFPLYALPGAKGEKK